MSEALANNAADRLATRRAEIAAALDDLAGDGRTLALQAALGDRLAARKLTRHQARAGSLTLQLTALDQALAQAHAENDAAAAAAGAKQRDDRKHRLESLLLRRLDLSADIDAALRRLITQIAALDLAAAEISGIGREMGFTVAAFHPLGREAGGGRLAEFMAGIGYDSWLPLSRPEIRPAIANLRDAEEAAQEIFRAGLNEVAS